MTDKMKDQLARVRQLAARVGVSDEELRQYLAAGMANAGSADKGSGANAGRSRRLSLYEKSILLSVMIGVGYVIDRIIRCGFQHALGTLAYVVFCLFMISSKRFFEHRVGTYIIGTGIRLPPDYRPMWGSGIVLGWVFLSLPAVLTVLRVILIKE